MYLYRWYVEPYKNNIPLIKFFFAESPLVWELCFSEPGYLLEAAKVQSPYIGQNSLWRLHHGHFPSDTDSERGIRTVFSYCIVYTVLVNCLAALPSDTDQLNTILYTSVLGHIMPTKTKLETGNVNMYCKDTCTMAHVEATVNPNDRILIFESDNTVQS